MGIFRCLLLFALIAAASATFGKRVQLSKNGKCGFFCGLTTRNYHPARNTGKCLGVFGFLAAGVNAKLNLVSDIFNAFSNIGAAENINAAVDTCLNLSRAIGLIIDRWIEGLGVIFNNIVIAISRLIFCVLGKQKHSFFKWFTLGGKASPAVCSNDFGIKWGWKKYLRGYSSYNEIIEYYNLKNVRGKIEGLLKAKGLKISGLKGTHKLIIETILDMNSLLQRKFSIWQRNDFVEVTKYLITISAAVGSAYKADAGVAVVDEYCEYLEPCYRKEFNVEIVEETTIIKEKIQYCDSVSFEGALKVDANIKKDSSYTLNSGDGVTRTTIKHYSED